MAITLGDPTSAPVWNRYILVPLFMAQLFLTFIFCGALFFFWAFGGGAFVFLALAINLLGIVAICYEIYLFVIENLSLRTYYRFQIGKSTYAGLVLLASLVMRNGRGLIFVLPFWAAMGYADYVRRKEGERLKEVLGFSD